MSSRIFALPITDVACCWPPQTAAVRNALQLLWAFLTNCKQICWENVVPKETRSQAVARIADRTASQHLWGHVTSSVTWPFDSPYVISYWWSFGTKPLSLTVSELFKGECNAMVDMTLIRPLNKGQGHSCWYQSISHIGLHIGSQ